MSEIVMNQFFQRMSIVNRWLLRDAFGGPRPFKLAWIINAQKGGTLLFLGAMMLWYADRTPSALSTASWTYLALHGGYGLVWLMKDIAFPDPAWQVRITLGSTLLTAIALGAYWSFGWLLISGVSQPHYPLATHAWCCLCILLCLCGCALMIAADAQKYYTLRLQGGLIVDGMFAYIRHPNYLGEMMIYLSFALLVWHWWPAIVLLAIWGGLFATNIARKEASLSRHPGWHAYRARSWYLLPGVF